MERKQHIAETQDIDSLYAQTESDETAPEREDIPLAVEYDQSTETNPEQIRVREYINSFEEDRLEEIFLEHFRRAGSDEATMNWIPFEEIRIAPSAPEVPEGESQPSAHYFFSNKIVLYAPLLKTPEQVLENIIHEELHAVSRSGPGNRLTGTDEIWNAQVNIHAKETGFSKQTKEVRLNFVDLLEDRDGESIDHPESGDRINEGATEFIAQKILQQYIEQTATLDKDYPYEGLIRSGYFEYQQCLELYTRLLSYLSDVPLDAVVQGVVRAYLRNGAIVPREMKDELDKRDASLTGKLLRTIENGDSGDMVTLAVDFYQESLISKEEAQLIIDIYSAGWDARMEYLYPDKKVA